MRFQAIFLFFCCCLANNGLLAQDFVLKKDFDRRSVKYFEAAESAIRRQNFSEANAQLTDLLQREPKAIDALLLRAGVAFESQRFAAAETDYERALQLAPDYKSLTYYQLARTEMKLEKFAEAVEHFQAYLAKIPQTDRRRARAEDFLRQAQQAAAIASQAFSITPISIGDGINTPGKEYLPAFTADGRYLIYTVNYDGQEDFYYSEKDSQGQWQKGQPLVGVNTPQGEGAQSISPDGKLLFFTGCNRKSGLGSCDLYYTEQENGEWQAVQLSSEPLSSAYWDAQPSLSANGQFLYFSSDRPGGLGKRDIWYSQRQADGNWGVPKNLGKPINSAGNDESPFIHADGQTLYFMSDGHPGLGDSDLFIARRDSSGHWQVPQNLGPPINTAAQEGALTVSLDGHTAYYTTDQNTQQGQRLNLDIYQFDLPEALRPKPVTYLEAVVVDARTERPLNEVIVTIVSETALAAGSSLLRTDQSGKFLAVLPAASTYQVSVEKEGYLFYSDRFELGEGFTISEPFQLTIALQEIPAGSVLPSSNTPIVLSNVLFATGSAELLPSSDTEIQRLADLLQRNENLHVRINGHTDNVGTPEANQQLSEARAKAVYQALLDSGAAADRLSYKGFGESKPLDTNETPEGRKRNRRTEFELVE